jgi:hypothetical protein
MLALKNTETMLSESGASPALVQFIESNLPAISQATANFGKTQSQFMDNMLTVAHPTPLRNCRQILAQVNRSLEALRESYFKTERTKLEIKKTQKKLREAVKDNALDDLEVELLELEIDEKTSSLEAGKLYIAGAIRQITNYIEQYKAILQAAGVKSFDEFDFEAEEEKYHIMKAFEQAICAARARGGMIDEGNHIYFYQIGINGAAAQAEITGLFVLEKAILKENKTPDHSIVRDFLGNMAKKYAGCSGEFAQAKGQTGEISKRATLKLPESGDC